MMVNPFLVTLFASIHMCHAVTIEAVTRAQSDGDIGGGWGGHYREGVKSIVSLQISSSVVLPPFNSLKPHM